VIGKVSVALLLPAAKFAVTEEALEMRPDSSTTETVAVEADPVSRRKTSMLTDCVVWLMLTDVAWSEEK
jgi:hypothetical protein